MGYNTRRKSLSLPSLGIALPTTKPSASTPCARPAEDDMDSQHPSKKRRLETSMAVPAPLASSAAHSKPAMAPTNSRQPLSASPSPALQKSIESDDSLSGASFDLASIKDEVVHAVVVRLQETNNRPHLVKDLAIALANKTKMVQQSTNPCSIISHRLTAYLKRSGWSASSPCPLTKETEPVHPRRTYFFLATHPRQPLPPSVTAQPPASRGIVTPSLSSSGSTAEDTDIDRRRELSLSPEVDLHAPEFDDMEDMSIPSTPMGSAPGRHSASLSIGSRAQRGAEPPLEKDEKEFTQTADGLQKRKLTGKLLSADPVDLNILDDSLVNEQLFGDHHRTLGTSYLPHMAFLTSPAMRPSMFPPPPKRDTEAENWSKLDAMLDWDKSPEMVELDELDGLLNDI